MGRTVLSICFQEEHLEGGGKGHRPGRSKPKPAPACFRLIESPNVAGVCAGQFYLAATAVTTPVSLHLWWGLHGTLRFSPLSQNDCTNALFIQCFIHSSIKNIKVGLLLFHPIDVIKEDPALKNLCLTIPAPQLFLSKERGQLWCIASDMRENYALPTDLVHLPVRRQSLPFIWSFLYLISLPKPAGGACRNHQR